MREFVWHLDEMPRKGTIVVVAHGSQPLRWAYLPDGATRLDVESAITQGYRWYKSAVDCQATILKDTNITDYWRFTVLPATVKGAESVQPMKAGQLVSDRPRRLVRIVRRLCAVLILQVSIGFAVAQQNVTDPQQEQVQKEPRDLLKEEIAASENQTAKQGLGSLSESALVETPKMALMRTWITKQSNDLLDIIKVLYKGRDAELKELETAQAKMSSEDQIEHRIVLIKETLLQKEAK